jgi:hypothetical protein
MPKTRVLWSVFLTPKDGEEREVLRTPDVKSKTAAITRTKLWMKATGRVIPRGTTFRATQISVPDEGTTRDTKRRLRRAMRT